MKRTFPYKFLTAFLAIIVILVGSCTKNARNESVQQPDETEITAVTAAAMPYIVISNAIDAMFAGATPGDESNQTSGRKYGCATVTATPGGANNVFPKTVLIDFGTGCTLRGYTGKGSISFNLAQWIFIPGTTVIPEFHDFYVNGYKVEGDYKVTSISATEFKVDIIDGVITDPDGVVFHTKGVQYYTQTKGADTPFVFGDDSYAITGNGTVQSATITADLNVKKALVKEVNCTNIVEGVLEIKSNIINADLDFGDGTCDNKGSLIIGPLNVPITLPF